jgi:Helix-turn-helix domain/Competence protein CoiA-like family
MSIEASNWARRFKLAVSRKAVLLALTDHLNGRDGRCDPSHKTITQETGLSSRTISYALRDLEALRLIITHHDPGRNSKFTINVGMETPAKFAGVHPGKNCRTPLQLLQGGPATVAGQVNRKITKGGFPLRPPFKESPPTPPAPRGGLRANRNLMGKEGSGRRSVRQRATPEHRAPTCAPWPGGNRSDAAMAELLLPFGKRVSDGRIVSPAEVANGLDCGCICPECGRRLVAKQGDIVIHHFAHEVDADCARSFETSIHALSKQIISEARFIQLPGISSAGYSYSAPGAACAGFDRIEVEVSLPGMRPDIIAHRDQEPPLLIEIAVTHACDAVKIERIRERRLPAIEISLSDYLRDLSSTALRVPVLIEAPRKWLYHDAIERLIEAARLQRVEDVRRDRAIREQWERAREDRERAQLVREDRERRDREYEAQLRREERERELLMWEQQERVARAERQPEIEGWLRAARQRPFTKRSLPIGQLSGDRNTNGDNRHDRANR